MKPMPNFGMPVYGVREKIRDRIGIGRYHNRRVMILSFAMLLVVFGPAFDLWHLDIYNGHYWVMGRRVTLVYALKSFIIGFIAVNVVILIANAIVGRFLCGWFCPVATLNRVGEWGRRHLPKWGRVAVAGAIGAALGLGMITWVFDPVHVFEMGPAGLSVFAAIWAFLTVSVAGQILWLGHNFCLGLCPSGIYFSLTGGSARGGIHLKKNADCTDCGVCASVCPMHLDPVRLLEKSGEPMAMPYPVTDFDRCIRCGDCIEACERFGDPHRPEFTPPMYLGMGSRDVLNAELHHVKKTVSAKAKAVSDNKAA